MSTEIKKLVIDRSRWLRGEGSKESRLLRPRDEKMCCLGFLGLACGYLAEDLTDRATPTRTTDTSRWPEWLFGGPRRDEPSDAAYDLMQINDFHPSESEIADSFGQHGVEVEFIDGAPVAPLDPEKPSPPAAPHIGKRVDSGAK